MAAWNTNVSAGMGVLGWSIIDMIRYKGKLSTVGACEGAIAGLVGKFTLSLRDLNSVC